MTETGKLWIILNPTAARGKAATQQPKIECFLHKKNRDFELILTKGQGNAIEIAQDLPLSENDAVIAAGGDGTCNEVVNGLLRRNQQMPLPLILGILPVGRGNDFSSTPGIPKDIDKALELICTGKLRPLDIGLVKGGFYPDGRYFVNGVGIGFDTKVGFDAAKMKIKSGIAYALGAISNVVHYDPSPVLQICYGEDEKNLKEIMTLPAVLVSVVNGRRMGGSFYMGPNAVLDDGLLDICYVKRPKSRFTLINIIFRYTKGTQGELKGIYMDKAKHFRLTALEGGMATHCDGETVCYEGKELEISCIPSALRLIGA